MKNEVRSLGAVESKKDNRDFKISYAAKTNDLPEEFSLEHPEILNQGKINSCVAHSAAAISSFYKKDSNGENIKFATGFVYGYRPDKYYVGTGMMLRDALKTLKNCGNVEYKDFPGNVEMDGAQENVNKNLDRLLPLAAENKIVSYARVSDENNIKQMIFNGYPVMISILVYEEFDNEVDGYVETPKILSTSRGLHAVTIFGWTKTHWIVQNSWGEGFGDHGMCYLPFDYPIWEAWCVTDDQEVIQKPAAWWIYTVYDGLLRFFMKLYNFFSRKK
jgi:C1A family cysteine protease